MANVSHTGPQFEDEVRNIARNLFSNNIGQGSLVVDGRERDGVFLTGIFILFLRQQHGKRKRKQK